MPTTVELDPLALFRLDGVTAVVTGASSGRGNRFARVLHSVAASVVVAARRAERLLWHLAKLCTPSMIANGGGSVINVASMFGHVGVGAGQAAHHCASKAL